MGSIEELEQAAVRLLSVREHSRLELYRKLQPKADQSDELESVLDRLETRGYLSDSRFAEQYIESRVRKGFGPLRITLELQERGIDPESIKLALAPFDSRWPELLQTCCMRKFGDLATTEYKALAKRARFLEYRGFPSELIREALWP